MQWTDRIRQTKILLVVAAIVIAVASLVASNLLTRDLYEEEHKKMEILAEAMRTLNVSDDNGGMNLVLKVIEDNTTIPIVVMDENGQVQTSRNIDLESHWWSRGQGAANAADSLRLTAERGKRIPDTKNPASRKTRSAGKG